ncbi:MAG TPA: amidase [Pyrinomonadaceae bacterium]|nr:amidase [Pyrinomonadaceae bacterium]
MDELTFQSATALCDMMRRREVSPVDVLQAHLRRIEKINPRLNAIVTIAPDAVSKAKEAEAAIIQGKAIGELTGLPITIKDTIETAGLRSTSGSSRRAHFVPNRDAPAIARLKAKGAIILAKTNTAEMAMDYTADNPVFGRTHNPYDLSRTPGGSSGGEAAAIAACLSPAGIGSDLAGSIRIPSHFCGIAGLKPGSARVPGAGQFPPSIGPYSLGSAIGPLARYVEDLKLLFSALIDVPLQESKGDALQGQRVGWYASDDTAPVTAETLRAVESAARALADAGLAVQECRPPGIEQGFDLWLKLFSWASVVQLRDVYQDHEEEGGGFVRWRLATADDTLTPSLDDYIHAWMERDRLREALIDWMARTPLLVAPVGATPAFKHDTLKISVAGERIGVFRAFSYSQSFNAFDLPAVSVPAGRSAEGLPIGIQIIGRPFAEFEVLRAARIVEKALGGWQPPPEL